MKMDAQLGILEKFSIPFALLGVSNILINSFLINALRKLKKLHTMSFKFILLLSVSNLCDGVNSVSFAILHQLLAYGSEKLTTTIALTLKYFFAQFSFTMISIIAIDRYIQLRYFSK